MMAYNIVYNKLKNYFNGVLILDLLHVCEEQLGTLLGAGHQGIGYQKDPWHCNAVLVITIGCI